MVKRPILVAVIGYIIGILWGLYLKFSIVLFYILIFATYYIYMVLYRDKKKRKFKLLSLNRYSRYLKLIINKATITIIVVMSVVSNAIVCYQNNKYKTTFQDEENTEIIGIVVSTKIEKQYYDLYIIKIQDSQFKMYIQVNKKEKLEYGDKLVVKGKYSSPSKQRNYGGYDDSMYLKTKKILGRVKADNIKLIAKNQCNFILQLANKANLLIKEKIDKIFEGKNSSLLKGLLLGDKQNIEDEVKENYQILNISHILAVSGMHIGYIILAIQLLFKKIIGKKYAKITTIIILIIYIFITGFSPSIIRASVMAILVICSTLFHKKNDIWNSISISLLGILIYNPFFIIDIGLQLSYLGTIGIILFHSTCLQVFNQIKFKKDLKIIKYIKEVLSVTISAQIMIFPILLFNYNIVGVYSLVANLFISNIIGIIIIFSFVIIAISFVFNPIVEVLSLLLNVGLEILNFISNLSKLPFAKIYINTPSVLEIILYYIIIFVAIYIYKIYTLNSLTITQKRIKNLIALFRYKFISKKQRYLKYTLIIFVILIGFQIIPKNLKIYFVDVGQGDCTFIVTPKNKTILIDGGGSIFSEFDVGKNTLIPYLLDRGYTRN